MGENIMQCFIRRLTCLNWKTSLIDCTLLYFLQKLIDLCCKRTLTNWSSNVVGESNFSTGKAAELSISNGTMYLIFYRALVSFNSSYIASSSVIPTLLHFLVYIYHHYFIMLLLLMHINFCWILFVTTLINCVVLNLW